MFMRLLELIATNGHVHSSVCPPLTSRAKTPHCQDPFNARA